MLVAKEGAKQINFILLNDEQRTPDAAVGLAADKETLLHQMLNVELKSRKQFPSDSLLQPHALHYFPNTATKPGKCLPNSYNATATILL